MTANPLRILHVFGVLSRTGGAEKWILDLLRREDNRVQFDFLLSIDDGPIASEVRQRGSQVHLVPFSRSPFPWSIVNPYLRGVRAVLQRGQYDVVHVHQFDLAGEILRIAEEERVPGRIMSVHATAYENPHFYRRFVYRYWGRPWIFRHATAILPCSRAVAEFFVPPQRSALPTTEILYTGIDPMIFRNAMKRRHDSVAAVRSTLCKEWNIPLNARIIGHIGRFTRQKNHVFLLKLLESAFRCHDDWFAVLVGHGELLEPVRDRVRQLGLKSRIIVPGPRSDVPDLITSLFDVLLLPSLYEGLPLVGIEALAGGLGLVVADTVSDELDSFFPDRVGRVPLKACVDQWVDAIDMMILRRCGTIQILDELERSPFTIHASLEHLIHIYVAPYAV